MNKELLNQVGIWLYGDNWRAELSRALDVKFASVKKWASGEYNIPPGLASDILAIVKDKRDSAPDIIARLEAAILESTRCD